MVVLFCACSNRSSSRLFLLSFFFFYPGNVTCARRGFDARSVTGDAQSVCHSACSTQRRALTTGGEGGGGGWEWPLVRLVWVDLPPPPKSQRQSDTTGLPEVRVRVCACTRAAAPNLPGVTQHVPKKRTFPSSCCLAPSSSAQCASRLIGGGAKRTCDEWMDAFMHRAGVCSRSLAPLPRSPPPLSLSPPPLPLSPVPMSLSSLLTNASSSKRFAAFFPRQTTSRCTMCRNL